MTLLYGTREIASFDAVLHADVARIIFAINEGRAVSFAYIGKFTEGNLLAGGRADQQVGDLLRVLAELRLHAHDEVEQFFALNHLRGGLSAHGRLHHRFHVGNIDAVAGDFVAIHVDQQAGLAQLAHHGEFREARNL